MSNQFTNIKIALLGLLILISNSIYGQDSLITTRLLTIENGLSHNSTHAIHQDKLGFIWIGTDDGLNRFDGHEFRWFTKKDNGLEESKIGKIVADKWGKLWLLKDGRVDVKKVSFIDINNFEVSNLKSRFGESSLLIKDDIIDILSSPNQEIIIQTKSGKFYFLSDKNQLQALPINPKLKLVFFNKKQEIWGRLNNAIVRINLKGNVLESIPINKDSQLMSLNEDDKGQLWWFEMQYYQSTTTKRKAIQLKCKIGKAINQLNTSTYNDNLFNLKIKNQQGKVIIHNRAKFRIYNPKTLEVEQEVLFKDTYKEQLKDVFCDNQNTFWVANRSGVVMMQKQTNRFEQYLKLTDEKKDIRGILENNDFLYVGTKPTEIINLSSKEKHTISFTKDNKIFIPYSIKMGNDGNVWFGAKDLYKIDGNNHQVLKQFEAKNNIDLKRIYSIVQDDNDVWWISSKNGFYYFNENKYTELQEFTKFNNFPEFRHSKKWHLLLDGQFLWVSTNVGLFLIDKKKGIIGRYHSEGKGKYYLPSSEIQYLYKDKAGVFYLATLDTGLIIWDKKAKKFQQINRRDGFLSNDIYAIIEDKFGYLWMSSQNGLIQMNKKTLSSRVYLLEDGLTDNEFNKSSYFQNKNGKIYFGGLNGLIGFYPKYFQKEGQQKIDFKLSEISMLRREEVSFVNLTDQFRNNGDIFFHKMDQVLRIKFSLQDYLYADETVYSYKIKGQNSEWIKIQGNELQINRLPSGHYTLIIQAKGKNNAFTPKEISIPLIVLRPIYANWWFILGIVLIGIFAGFKFYQWRVQYLKTRQIVLENLVVERTAQIQKDKTTIEEQAEKLKELDKLKSRFFANISHELRTPLTLVLSPLDNILNSNELSNRNFTYLQLVRQNAKKLLNRINELLELSRLDAKRLAVNLQPINIYQTTKQIAALYEGAAMLKGIQLNYENSIVESKNLLIDTANLEMIISNFLSNAIKFTPKNGQIDVQIKKESASLLISVKDTGTGIPKEELNKIFDRFYQVKGKNYTGGSGIGLSLCKELADLQGGKVWATSEIGEGSIFYLKLPYKETYAKVEIETNPLSEQIEKTPIIEPKHHLKTILIVEDNYDLRQYIEILLSQKYNVVTAENGKVALEYLKKTTTNSLPSAIISDIMMPIMDGMELLKILKKEDAFRQIPVIMLTAQNISEVKIEALRIGVDDYLTKPFKSVELTARIENLINNAQQRAVQLPNSTTVKKQSTISESDLVWLKTVEQKILGNITNPNFKLQDLANELFISIRTLQQKIKAITGLTPKQYERKIKLNEARKIIHSGTVQTVSELTYQLGFGDQHYFSKIYKKEFGVTPKQALN